MLEKSVETLTEERHLRKELTPFGFWIIAVGLVISGAYYGFSYGFATGGPVSFLIAFLIVSVFYILFVFCYTELAASIPHAGGPSAYARRAMGPFVGYLAGFSLALSFIVAPCALVITVGGLLNFLFPAINPAVGSIAFYVIFVCLNLLGVKSSVLIETIVTVIALIGLGVYAIVAAPHWETANFITQPVLTDGITGIAGAICFAMWFFYAIELAAMEAEEMKNPRKDIPKAYIAGVFTLFITGLIAVILPAGIADYTQIATSDYPLAKSFELALGPENIWVKIFAYIAFIALVASFISVILGTSRQVYAMSRTGYLPKFLSKINRFGAPHWSLIAPGGIMLIVILSRQVATAITIAAFLALIMYIIALISLFVLRTKEPDMNRPFKVSYPIMPVIASIFLVIMFFCVLLYNWKVLTLVAVAYVIAIIYYYAIGRKNIRPYEEEFNID